MSAALDPSTRTPLGRAFVHLFGASLASNLGDGVTRTIAPLLAARLTDDPLQISGIAALTMLPWLFFAIPAGVAADRMDRRVALAVAQAVRILTGGLLVFLVATGTLTIWWLFAIAFVMGTCATLYEGAVRAIPPTILAPSALPRANGLLTAGEQVMTNFVAGPLSSALFAVAVLIPVVGNVAFYLGAGVLALLLPSTASGLQYSHPSDEGVGFGRQLTDGWRFIVADPMLVWLWVVSAVREFGAAFATASMVLYVLGPLGIPEAWYGVFLLSGAIGGVLGAVVADPVKRRFGGGWGMFAGLLVTALGFLLLGAVAHPAAAAAGFLASALGGTLWSVLAISLRQAAIPNHLLGRTQGTWRTVMWGMIPLGAALGGLVGRAHLALPFLLGGAVCLVLALAAVRFLSRLPNPEQVVPRAEA